MRFIRQRFLHVYSLCLSSSRLTLIFLRLSEDVATWRDSRTFVSLGIIAFSRYLIRRRGITVTVHQRIKISHLISTILRHLSFHFAPHLIFDGFVPLIHYHSVIKFFDDRARSQTPRIKRRLVLNFLRFLSIISQQLGSVLNFDVTAFSCLLVWHEYRIQVGHLM